ncbi:hypothetical protein E4V01_13640 [Methylorubrum sp. Q1]|uniref:hypothetical protein n=1 Tax=Methylorubrum sp. Q1 TaxID=2562453 RepID=UPI001075EB99|nr:hypothetical protein [Methylorubrum sp. Q1]TFZ57672.1 hypothetical protein E4V01_13640 [Methylorubrum sp. Q1]
MNTTSGRINSLGPGPKHSGAHSDDVVTGSSKECVLKQRPRDAGLMQSGRVGSRDSRVILVSGSFSVTSAPFRLEPLEGIKDGNASRLPTPLLGLDERLEAGPFATLS